MAGWPKKWVIFEAETRDFSLLNNTETGSQVRLAPRTLGTRDFPQK
jgi:hypothetical protein